MKETFATWLSRERRDRGWSIREAARRGRISHTSLADTENGDVPSLDTCKGIARAFGIRDVDVLRLAGLIDPKPPTDMPVMEEIVQIASELDEDDQEYALRMLEGLRGTQLTEEYADASQAYFLKNLHLLNDDERKHVADVVNRAIARSEGSPSVEFPKPGDGASVGGRERARPRRKS